MTRTERLLDGITEQDEVPRLDVLLGKGIGDGKNEFMLVEGNGYNA